MDAPGNMYFIQMLMLLLLMGVCTFWLGRVAQWLLLRKKVPGKTMWFIILHSTWISYLIALLIWFFWPQNTALMLGIFCLPVVISEIIILLLTFILLKKRKRT